MQAAKRYFFLCSFFPPYRGKLELEEAERLMVWLGEKKVVEGRDG